MGCEKEASDECKQNSLLFHGKRVSSFFKVMIDKSFRKILYFPPMFARSVSHLTDQETYLEDSSGQRWRVTVCDHKGSLAIRQGWPKFSSEHGLNLGDFLVFYYVVEVQYFIVQIYDKSGCQKIKFYSDSGKGKRKTRTYPEATSQVKLLQTTDINPANKRSKISAVSESKKVPCKTHIKKFATNIDADTGKGQLVYPAVYVDESFCMIDRDAQYHQGDDRLCLHLSSFEMPASKPLAEGTSSLLKADGGNSIHVETNLRSQTEPNLVVVADYLNSEELLPKFEAEITGTDMVPAKDIPLLSQKDQNDCPSGIISSSFLKPAANINKNDGVSNVTKYQNHWMSTDTKSMMLQSDNKDGRCTGSNQITREKSNEASWFARETRLVKKEYEETAAEAYYPARAISGKEPANGEKVIKSEPADSGDMPSLKAVSYSCLLEVDGRDFLELPESWRKYLMKKAKLERWIIFLRGPDKKIWPIIYHRRAGVDVLTNGWKTFAAAYGLNRGDDCLFELENQLECIFAVRKL